MKHYNYKIGETYLPNLLSEYNQLTVQNANVLRICWNWSAW